LEFRGHEDKWGSPNNGNFMGAIELIAEFNPFYMNISRNVKMKK